jgi:hypothetical protein
VFETFPDDSIGISSVEQCGRIVFESEDNLLEKASKVVRLIDQGVYNDFSHVDWWKNDIHWDLLLLQVIGQSKERRSKWRRCVFASQIFARGLVEE